MEPCHCSLWFISLTCLYDPLTPTPFLPPCLPPILREGGVMGLAREGAHAIASGVYLYTMLR